MTSTTYGLRVRVDKGYDETVAAVREALAQQGFGVLTEIDVAATMKNKLGVDEPPQVILGACNPPLAHRALQAEASVGLLLPCNVVVRTGPDGGTLVEALDPSVMVGVTGNPALAEVADEAGRRLSAALQTLEG